MKKFLFLILLSLFILQACSTDKYKNKRNLTIVFYNVENLFDLSDEPGKKDEEFTPEGTKKWTADRYQKKLDTLSHVLSAVSNNELPEIIGLCEVENKTVLSDLIQTQHLIQGNYNFVHYESPDFRGIDCALLYRPKEFKVVHSEAIKVNFKGDPNYLTRDILYVKGRTSNREIFHIFINHWPSRIGGTEKTEPKRIEVATLLKEKVDSIQAADKKAKIIVMGDMNDEPSNNSLAKVLQAQNPEDHITGLVNLMYQKHLEGEGSYSYRGNWNMLDHVIVSDNLLDNKGWQNKEKSGFIFSQTWMEYKNNSGQISPSRTYGGPNYYGGLSDHFPVYFTLQR